MPLRGGATGVRRRYCGVALLPVRRAVFTEPLVAGHCGLSRVDRLLMVGRHKCFVVELHCALSVRPVVHVVHLASSGDHGLPAAYSPVPMGSVGRVNYPGPPPTTPPPPDWRPPYVTRPHPPRPLPEQDHAAIDAAERQARRVTWAVAAVAGVIALFAAIALLASL